LVTAFLAAGVAVWALTGDDEGGETPTGAVEPPGAEEDEAPSPAPGEKQLGEEEGAGDAAPSAQARRERRVERVVRRYVAAVDARDGVVLCGVVDGIEDLSLPVRRSSCAESVSESIGYRDPRGFPVFESVVVSGGADVEAGPREARATVTVVTEFADRDEPSIEDDVIYLVRRGGGWMVAKPSSTLYRAIGAPDAPPDVLEPPE
jgi:hypothetical protein